jgi:PhoH-like ATPase
MSYLIDLFYKDEDITGDVEDFVGRKLFPNEFISIRSGSQSLLGCKVKNKIQNLKASDKLEEFIGVKPRNKEQLFALNLLCRDDIPLVSLTGLAGSGKTFLTLMSGLDGLNKGKYKRIVITRNIQPVGRDIGFLPGDADDKMLPWIAPIMDNFRQGTGDQDLTYFDVMRRSGKIG